jgi:hypothetical protein
MDMEGTKHEKAVIVVLAYIVGFTSGFIAFGVTQPDLQSIAPIEMPLETGLPTETVPVTSDGTKLPMTDTAPTAGATENDYTVPKYTEGTHVYYENGRLFLSVDGNVSLLSIERNRMAANVTEFFRTQGSHVAIPHYALSPDNKFVYFCEQQGDADSCVSFIYDVTAQTIQFVVDNGEKVTLTAAEAKTGRFDGATLVIGLQQSTDPTTPWKVAQK